MSVTEDVENLVFLQYLVLLKKLPAEDSLSPEELDLLLRPLGWVRCLKLFETRFTNFEPYVIFTEMTCVCRDLCGLYHQDQKVSAAVLLTLLPCIRILGKTRYTPEEMRHVQGSLLQMLSGFW